MRTRRLLLISCAPRRRGRDGLRRDPKLALNLLLDEPPKLLEELPHRASTTSATSATGGRRLSSASPRSYCPPPWLSPAGFLMPEVGRSPRLPAAVWTGVYAECGALARLRLRHVSSRERWPPFIAQRRNCKRAAPTRHSPLVVLARPSGQGLLALASPPSEVTHSQVYWLVLPEEARATRVIPCYLVLM